MSLFLNKVYVTNNDEVINTLFKTSINSFFLKIFTVFT